MYLFLKHDTFFLPTENNGIFFRNNYNNIKVNVKEAYLLFQKILPFLDGSSDLKKVLNQIKDVHIRKFYNKLLLSLNNKGFLISSDVPINFDKLDDLSQIESYYSNKLNNNLKDAYAKKSILVRSSSKHFYSLVTKNVLKNKFNVADDPSKCSEAFIIFSGNEDVNNLRLLHRENKAPYVLYAKENEGKNKLIIKKVAEDKTLNEKNFIDTSSISDHVLSFLTAIVELEIIWDWGGLKDPRVMQKSYIYDLDQISGKFM